MRNGKFLNYVDNDGKYHDKNSDENLEDSNGRAIWALGEFISNKNLFSDYFIIIAKKTIEKALGPIAKMHSPRAMAFAIKGLYHYNLVKNDPAIKLNIFFILFISFLFLFKKQTCELIQISSPCKPFMTCSR